MEIKFIPVSRIYNDLKTKLEPRMNFVYNQDNHFEGEFTKQCEDFLKSYTGRKYAFVTTSGTASITIMLMAAGAKPGSKVASTNYSCPATVMPIKMLSAIPVYNDINLYGQQDFTNLSDVDFILATGLYGDCYDHDQIKNIDVPILNDSAQSFGAKYNDKESTSLGDMSIISFSTNKNCPIFGTYGAVLTDNQEYAEKIFLMRRNGYRSRDVGTGIEHIGMNAQPHEDKSVQLLCSLEKLPQWQNTRQNIANDLDVALKKLDVCLRKSPSYSTKNNHKYCIFVEDKWQFRDKMSKFGVECHLHYTYNFSKTPVLKGETLSEYPWTEFYRKHAISIPSNPWLTVKEINYIINSIEKCITKEDRELCHRM